MINYIISIPKKIVLILITFYQKFFSFDHSFWAKPEKIRICIHYPSCSEYTREAIIKHGVVKGAAMGTSRILRCNPMSKGGYDPVPDKFSLKANQGNN